VTPCFHISASGQGHQEGNGNFYLQCQWQFGV
jgi:hypothetical protein